LALTFEVRQTDLCGRIGSITVGGKRLQTPCLLPVVHPVRQSISPRELGEMGFHAIMTNSYIIHERRRDEATAKGVHDLLDYDGIVMTDSGGYQVLEYGEVGIDYRESARFQSAIGSDLAVTLDRPTGYSRSAKYSRETMKYSLDNAVATLKEFGGSRTVWVGPVQGGLFRRLLEESTRSLVGAGFAFLALGSPTQVMENYRFAELAKMIIAVRRVSPFSVPLHLFGAGHTLTMALSIALGCDTFDSASYVLFARDGRYMTELGVLRLEEMSYLPCSCPACVRTTVAELLEMGQEARTRAVSIHNLHALLTELEFCKEAIAEGRLWDLVQQRAAAHPRLFEAFLELSKEAKLLGVGTRPYKDRGLFVRGEVDLWRPELAEAARRLKSVGGRTFRRALLLVGGDQIPAGRIRAGRGEETAVGADVYRLHPVLGLYPAELDYVYPFTQTVSALGRAEPPVKEAEKELKARGYSEVLVCPVDEGGLVRIPAVRNRQKSRAASPSLRRASSRPRSPRHP
jgi:7-cyano-7-deazaguanine tRNA-ribosyltransferase